MHRQCGRLQSTKENKIHSKKNAKIGNVVTKKSCNQFELIFLFCCGWCSGFCSVNLLHDLKARYIDEEWKKELKKTEEKKTGRSIESAHSVSYSGST